MEIEKAEKLIIDLLDKQLSPTLYYHGLHHTLDVLNAAMILANEEGIEDRTDLKLLQTAALFHDSGFIKTYKNHEEEGCRIANLHLSLFGYSPEEIKKICGMIMATKIPQAPKTILEEILCDADLDYLGRDDFEPIAASLFEELKARKLVENEKTWNVVQVKFLESHRYHTKSAINKREVQKQKRLTELRKLI
jgi:uncharacterized protein